MSDITKQQLDLVREDKPFSTKFGNLQTALELNGNKNALEAMYVLWQSYMDERFPKTSLEAQSRAQSREVADRARAQVIEENQK